MTVKHCADCAKKDEEITYLKALIALESVGGAGKACAEADTRIRTDVVQLKQRQALLRRQLLLIRADVQYFNRHVQSVFEWIAKVITVFLSSCGRLGQSTASAIVEMSANVSKPPRNTD